MADQNNMGIGKINMQFKFLLFIVLSYYVFIGCASINDAMEPTAHEKSTVVPDLANYNGPKARIAIQRFDVKAAKANGEIGDGLRDMLATALVQSNHFSVVERQELPSLMQEQELSASGATEKSTRIKRGALKSADLIITGTVTEFEDHDTSTGVGVFGGTISGVVGGLGTVINRAYIGVDLRIVDTSTGEVIAAKKVVGKATDASIGSLVGGFGGGYFGGAGLGMYKNTPMEKAVRICIDEAVKYLIAAVPQKYYKY
jgi:curli biogenesis system outer membrane secretion channel CsgG